MVFREVFHVMFFRVRFFIFIFILLTMNRQPSDCYCTVAYMHVPQCPNPIKEEKASFCLNEAFNGGDKGPANWGECRACGYKKQCCVHRWEWGCTSCSQKRFDVGWDHPLRGTGLIIIVKHFNEKKCE